MAGVSQTTSGRTTLIIHMTTRRLSSVLLLLAGFSWPGPVSLARAQELSIVTPRNASWLETLAAKEVRRYVYARTGRLAPLVSADTAVPVRGDALVVARRDRPVIGSLLRSASQQATLKGLAAEGFWLKSVETAGRHLAVLTGADDVGTLYAAYRAAEVMGVRFYMEGDVLPDERVPLAPPSLDQARGAEALRPGRHALSALLGPLDELQHPLFALRGIQPFHDFPEGPDWWNTDDYLAVISQLPKLRMNFFGLHCYPEGGVGPEPLVWIGTPGDADAQGRVKFSYPSQWANTARATMWGYQARKTSAFAFGAAELFAREAFGPDVMGSALPRPSTPEECNALFDRTAAMIGTAFRQARRLGVRTCLGTETPLTVPKLVADRLKAQGKNPKETAVIQELYEGLFQRVANTCDLDYYWFWTPEGWTWEGTKPEQVAATTNDLFAAIAAHQKVKAPFRLATCGWVLGPQQDRALFDKLLPKDMPVSCINQAVGNTPVEKGFANVSGRGKWAIPWLEDDPGLTAPQLWVGRMRRDAADALRYGCDGLMGIHWRTRALGPAVSALAQAAWDQRAWIKSYPAPSAAARTPGPVGGKHARFPNNPFPNTPEATVYQSVRYDVSAYHLPASNGPCQVTLKFSEPNYKEANKRVFGVKLQGRPVIENLDIFAQVGQNHALDYTFQEVPVTNGWLDIEFTRQVEYPSIAAIVVVGRNFTRKINCGGEACQDYAADWPEAKPDTQAYAAAKDFYADWAQAQFGPAIAAPAATLFAKIDGRLPRPADWVNGPGGIRPDKRPWAEVRREYSFVDELAALRPQVRGPAALDRFDYWLGTFRYMRAMAQANCTWAALNNALGAAKAEKDPARQKQLAREQALPIRRALVAQVAEVYQHLLATLSNPGELGVLANWEQHLLPDLLDKPGAELAKLLGEPLPTDALPSQTYRGPLRVIVPTQRTSLGAAETFRLKALILSEQVPVGAALHWRALGQGEYQAVPLQRVARGVWGASLAPALLRGQDFEYYVQVTPARGTPTRFPAAAPALTQTVVVMGEP